MKVTKTIEVDVCDQCGEEVQGHHIKTCVSCKKEICPNCSIHFDVTIREIQPHGYPRSKGEGFPGATVRTSPSYETGLSGTYCGACGNGIDAALIAAGLVKREVKERRPSVVLD